MKFKQGQMICIKPHMGKHVIKDFRDKCSSEKVTLVEEIVNNEVALIISMGDSKGVVVRYKGRSFALFNKEISLVNTVMERF